MKITEIRVFKRHDSDKKLRAFATMTMDGCFVVRDIKIIEGAKGLFVAMPSRRVKEPCPKCRNGNVLRSRYCSYCGAELPAHVQREEELDEAAVRQSEHKDIAHPITVECRDYIQKAILEAYEQKKSKLQRE